MKGGGDSKRGFGTHTKSPLLERERVNRCSTDKLFTGKKIENQWEALARGGLFYECLRGLNGTDMPNLFKPRFFWWGRETLRGQEK